MNDLSDRLTSAASAVALAAQTLTNRFTAGLHRVRACFIGLSFDVRQLTVRISDGLWRHQKFARTSDFRLDAVRPPFRPPFLLGLWSSFFPRPEPLFFPPPLDLLTVAHARAFAVFFETPFFSYPFSMCSALRFCLLV